MTVKKILVLDETTGAGVEYTPITASAGAGDAGKPIATGADGMIDPSFLPAQLIQSFTASEAIAAGDLINIWNDESTPKVRKADGSTYSKAAHGFAPAGITLGASGNVTLWDGKISGLTGLTPGATYFLSATTPGGVVATAPTGSANIVQPVGVASSATELYFSTAPNRFTIRETV